MKLYVELVLRTANSVYSNSITKKSPQIRSLQTSSKMSMAQAVTREMTKLNLLTMIQKEYFSHLKTMKNSNSLGRKSLILRLKLLKKASILSQKLKPKNRL